MRAASAMKLLSVCCGGFLMAMPVALVDANKAYYDYRSDADRANPVGCGEHISSSLVRSWAA